MFEIGKDLPSPAEICDPLRLLSMTLGFYAFNVWSLKKKIENLQYMKMNPLKRKLADYPKDWPWGSFSFYPIRKHGLVRIDPRQLS